MKKRQSLLAAALTVGTFFSAQAMAQSIEITKDFKGFDKVSLSSAGELILKQGPKDSVRIEVDQALLPDLNVYKSGDTLNLGLKESDYRAGSLKFYVTMKNISAISDSNSGIVNVATDIKAKDLALSLRNSGTITTQNLVVDGDASVTVANSGTMTLSHLKAKTANLSLANSGTLNIDNLAADSLQSSLNNSGTISISNGVVNNQAIELHNSGTYNAANLKSKTGKVTISGSGKVYANVSDEISVNISGSGDLYLYGKPKFNNISTSGSGNIHTM